jgi:hypothetical protein
MMPGARFEIAVDGVGRSNRDTKAVAIEAGEFLKGRNPNSQITVRDRVTSETRRSW